MIKSNISKLLPHHIIDAKSNCDVYIADYTNQTKNLRDHLKKQVEIFHDKPPSDIESFTIQNRNKIEITNVVFDYTSFVRHDGTSRSQCECVLFPHSSTNSSWILFLELKYSSTTKHNTSDLNKARRQLYKSRYEYLSLGVMCKSNTCYLIGSLPKQGVPFPNFSIPQYRILELLKKHNVYLRFTNSCTIEDHLTING